MEIVAKIKTKYLNEILAGKKTYELRQFDSIELKEIGGQGREVVFEIGGDIERVHDDKLHALTSQYADIVWRPMSFYPVYNIPLGRIVSGAEYEGRAVNCQDCQEFSEGWRCGIDGGTVPHHKQKNPCTDFNPETTSKELHTPKWAQLGQ